jgi:beta-lactam-binding protein with PASTA domain
MEEPTTELRREPPPPWYSEYWWLWLAALLLIVGGIIAFFVLRDDNGGSTTPVTVDRSTVPNLVGLQERFARNVLRERGFQIEVVRQADTQRPGVVVEQDPGAGSRLARGGRVSIVVSTGPQPTQTVTETGTTTTAAEQAEVPDLGGTEYPDAVEQILDAGLFSNSSPIESTQERGNVVDQQPEAGAKVDPGSDVRIDVSLGSGEREDREVPDLVGQSVVAALKACAKAGFTCRTIAGSEEQRDVVGQQPKAGRTRPELAQILLLTG